MQTTFFQLIESLKYHRPILLQPTGWVREADFTVIGIATDDYGATWNLTVLHHAGPDCDERTAVHVCTID